MIIGYLDPLGKDHTLKCSRIPNMIEGIFLE